MDKPAPVERIEHILAAISSIEEFINGATLEAFAADELQQSAVKWNFLIIGEAIRNVDQSILDKYPYPSHIPKSFLNYFIESYNEVKVERTYFATQELDGLKEVMRTILRNDC